MIFKFISKNLKMSKIYTKTGDKGKTSLLGGKRVYKYDAQVTAYGNVDELNSCIGYVACLHPNVEKTVLIEIQKTLFTIGSNLASDNEKVKKLYKIADITEYDIQTLEEEIDFMTSEMPQLKNFILPGGNELMCRIHIARTVCRRAERSIVEAETDPFITKYVNRLSDYLFTLARYVGYKENVKEIKV